MTVWKYLEGSGNGLIEVQSQHCPGRTIKIHPPPPTQGGKKLSQVANVLLEIQTEHLQNVSREQ
jgi:hypothetical protein